MNLKLCLRVDDLKPDFVGLLFTRQEQDEQGSEGEAKVVPD